MTSDGWGELLSQQRAVRSSLNVSDVAPVGFILFDADGFILKTNPFVEELLGYSRADFVQSPLTQFIAASDHESFRQAWSKVSTSQDYPCSPIRMISQDRNVVAMHMRLSLTPPAPGLTRPLYLASFMDRIPAEPPLQSKSELIFQSALLDSIGEAIIATDLEGSILYWNKAAEQIYGWEAKEVLGKNIITITPVEESRDLGLEIMAALQAGQSWSGEFIVRHRDGRRFPARVTNTCLRDSFGNLSTIIGISSDLTEKKAMETQWQVLHSELCEQQVAMVNLEKVHVAEANRFKSEFIANMSHEIRTPLAVIRGYAELLTSDDLNVDRTECIESILRASRQVELLVNDILDIAKVEAGRLEIQPMPVSLATILSDIKEMLNIKVAEKNVKLDFAIPSAMPTSIQTDPFRLKQILLNVVGNAIKFTPDGEVSVKVAMIPTRGKPSSRLLSFVISDTGIGMTQEQSARIFGAFSQADRSITRNYGGNGLGLSLSLELARLLGGDLVLQKSEPGKGSTFLLTVDPGDVGEISKSPDPPLTLPSAALPARKISIEPNIRDMKILVVEDADDVRAIVKYFLQNQRASVTEATNGAEAIHLAHASPFDAILMDLQMPICDGFKATRHLRSEGCCWPIYALTAHAMTGEREKCLAAGFSGYLTKPINFREMIAVLSKERKAP
ncbi:MAG TPA: PAS domain S-box protein [Oligoflexus sp.]|uniref:PAS domain S-box protein n=1 Tax=Oligoflexus sp. TaxID=1971216 RepID=UPI002D6EBD88|nr:PAS domain S-box protein [Oligoflexus sp.]HYX31984.1 PAS domain S-box protein [Oligoflexus sp.]